MNIDFVNNYKDKILNNRINFLAQGNLSKNENDFENIIINKKNYFDISITNNLICNFFGLNCLKNNQKSDLNNEIITKLAHPCKNKFIGFDDYSNSLNLAYLCMELDFNNVVVVSNKKNVPFICLEDENIICEAWKNKVFEYKFYNSDFQIKEFSSDNLIIENLEHQKTIISDVFDKKIKNGFYDVIALNSGIALYISKKAKTILEGFEMSKNAIDKFVVPFKI